MQGLAFVYARLHDWRMRLSTNAARQGRDCAQSHVVQFAGSDRGGGVFADV
jgi:hypothetical protein